MIIRYRKVQRKVMNGPDKDMIKTYAVAKASYTCNEAKLSNRSEQDSDVGFGGERNDPGVGLGSPYRVGVGRYRPDYRPGEPADLPQFGRGDRSGRFQGAPHQRGTDRVYSQRPVEKGDPGSPLRQG